MSEQTRKITIVGLVILTLGLIAAAVYLGISIQRSQAPTGASASGDSCPSGFTFAGCGCSITAGYESTNERCVSGTQEICQAPNVGSSCTSGNLTCASSIPFCGGQSIGTNCTDSIGQTGTCTGTGGTNCYCQITSNTQCQFQGSTIAVGTVFCFGDDEVVMGGDCQISTVDAGACASSSSSSGNPPVGGQCSDYCAGDQECSNAGGTIVGSRCSGGSCSAGTNPCLIAGSSSSSSSSSGAPPVDNRSSCGGSCSSDADCRPAAGQGAGSTTCRAGICEATNCPAGQTVPGANCACSAGRSCGQTCGGTIGLCQDGLSTCSFISGNSCTGNENTNSTACVPNPIYTNAANAPTGWSSALCDANPNGNKLTKFQGRAPTLAEVQQACLTLNPVCGDNQCTAGENAINCVIDCATCGDNICSPGETTANCPGDCPAVATCGDNICSGNETYINCPGDCPSNILPNTALISDEADAALIGGLLLIGGLVALRLHAVDKTWMFANNSLRSAYDFYFGSENIHKREISKMKRSRSKYEQDLEHKLDKKK